MTETSQTDDYGSAPRRVDPSMRQEQSSSPRGDGPSPAAEVFSQSQNYIEQQKTESAERISGFAHAAREAAEQLKGQSPTVAHYVRQTMDTIDQVSRGVREKSLDQLMHDVTDFGRRQPIAFFGAAILAGVALSRLLKTATMSGADHNTPSST